jgi:phosphoglycolate phosphatase-like HAD superfamily hydrolase
LKKLVLFDIDGTLIHTGGAGTTALNKAFHRLFNIHDAFKDVLMAGKTDIQIIKEGLKIHGLSHRDGNVKKMADTYLQFLNIEIHNPERRLKPGIMDILTALKEQEMVLGLLTGNLEKGAWIKLSAFGLNVFFLSGAFGSDHEDRNVLLPIALKKFSDKGLRFTPRDCIVVGDTPRDVYCAKIHNAFCIAVATGPYSKQELSRTDADVVFDSLADVDECMSFIKRI